MKRTIPLALSVLIVAAVAGCGASPAAPATASPGTASSGGASTADLSGTWNGTGSDPQGPETLTWTVTQTGTNLSGSARLEPANATDGTCGSCHKQKAGSLSGTMVGTALTLTLDFPAGGGDLTPSAESR